MEEGSLVLPLIGGESPSLTVQYDVSCEFFGEIYCQAEEASFYS